MSACGIDPRNTHYFAKSQNHQGLKNLLSDTKFMSTFSFILHLTIKMKHYVTLDNKYHKQYSIRQIWGYQMDECSQHLPRGEDELGGGEKGLNHSILL